MASWRDVAAQVMSQPTPAAPVADTFGLDAELCANLDRLAHLPPPRRLADAKHWQTVISDALRLARDGWAAKALALGWDVEDLFGVGRNNSDEFEGLAVWLAGRDLLAISDWKARTICGAIFYREAFGRPNSPRQPAVPLWHFGRTT